MESTAVEADRIYTEVAGTTCYISGRRGVVTGLHREFGRLHAVFVKLDGTGEVLFVVVRNQQGERGAYHEVASHRVITRDDFDHITGLASARADMGWR